MSKNLDRVLKRMAPVAIRLPKSLGLEDLLPNGIRQIELEYTFYGKLKNVQDLDKFAAKKEIQEQWLVPVETDVRGKARIREINGDQWVLTTKIRREGVRGSEEVECLISKDMYASLREMGTGGYKKVRYYFPVPDSGLVWEIDAFFTRQGQLSDWVKVDLEVPNAGKNIPDLPIPFDQIISHQPQDYTGEEKRTVDYLWDELWTSLDADQLAPEPKKMV